MKRLIKVLIFLILPFFVSSQSNILRSNIIQNFNDSDTIRYFRVSPRILTSSLFNNENSNMYIAGLRLDAKIKDRLILNAYYDYLDGDFYSEIINYQDSLGFYYPGFGLDNNRGQFNIRYLANRFITLDAGRGKHFIGDGYQSLLLSDIGDSYPYVKITTEFGPFKYYNLYTTFMNPEISNFGRKKHCAIHYLDLAVTKNIRFGIFEAILWQSKSESVNRGYEIAYLNPIIFYRPVEFSKYSHVGNALMGINFRSRIKNSVLYGQFLLDDLNISKQADRDDNYQEGFFQNKYAYQLGLKGEIKDFKYLIEYNQVQPYTYGHRTILQNYSHMNQALAHPLGANFKEWVNILEIRKRKLTYKIKTMFTYVGLDSAETHYGQNIFESDFLASTGGQYSYGNYNGQGDNTVIFSIQPELALRLKWFDVFGLVYYRTKNSNLLDQDLILYSIGLRTFPFTIFQDY